MITCYQGDTKEWSWKLERDGSPLTADELTNASAQLAIPGLGIDATLVIDPSAEYPVTYAPAPSDTATAEGVYKGFITVTFADGKTETWPVAVNVRPKEV